MAEPAVPPSHLRTLPDVAVSEKGMRQLELWLNRNFKKFILSMSGIYFNKLNKGGWLSIETTTAAARAAAINNNAGLHIVVGDGEGSGGAGDFELVVGNDWNVDGVGNDFNLAIGNDWNVDIGNDFNPIAVNDMNLIADRDMNVIASGRAFGISGATSSTFKVTTAGQTMVFNDASGNPILTLTC